MALFRKVIRIAAEDSPNVRLARRELAAGRTPSNTVVVPGVLTWAEYQQRRKYWDEDRQCVGLDARFWEGKDARMFPAPWLDRAHTLYAELLRGRGPLHSVRKARAIGCDPGEGVAESSWYVGDEYGILEGVHKRTPDTTEITSITLDLVRRYRVDPTNVVFDRGGGGKQHADRLRGTSFPDYPRGLRVRTVAFGEAPTLPVKRGSHPLGDRKEVAEDRTVFLNRRAEMYWEARLLLDPDVPTKRGDWGEAAGYGLPESDTELRRQLAPVPVWYQAEGKLFLPPKNARPDDKHREQKVTMVSLVGCSPDRADAFVLMVHGLLHKHRVLVIGVG